MATSVASSPIDPRSQSSWTVTLGSSITKPSRSGRHSIVRYNHKPTPSELGNATSRILPGKKSSQSELLLKHEKQEWKYQGEHSCDADGYVLLLSREGKEGSAVLERLDGTNLFNLISTPTSTDKTSLRQQYPQLKPEEEDGRVDRDSVGEQDEEPDLDNPFDYRHFLKASVPPSKDALPKSGTSTTLLKAQPATKTPASRSTKPSTGSSSLKKRKVAPDSTQPASKRAKASQQSTSRAPKPSEQTAAAPIPTVRVTRKASLRDPSQAQSNDIEVDDDGELILENDEDGPSSLVARRKQPSAMSLALSGQLGGGPISLHSAASSPASRINSPAPERPAHIDDDGEEFDLGGNSPGGLGGKGEEEDGDVEDFELPSPVQDSKVKLKAGSAAAPLAAGEDDDDLGEQLARAMAEQEDDPSASQTFRVESEEESEEE